MDNNYELAGFEFFSNFDSANMNKVELVYLKECAPPPNPTKPPNLPDMIPDVEFNIWTKRDCYGSVFENGNRTWFYFGMRAPNPQLLVKLNMIDLNKQVKMYSHGMAPVYRVVPGRPHWERIRDRPSYNTEDDIFTVSFRYRTPESNCITYFAFTYPYSYAELQNYLDQVDSKFLNLVPQSRDDIYYTRECLCRSLEGRRIDLLTISSFHNVSSERETRLKNLFPDDFPQRPYRFIGKKVIFVSARVHPGETPASFVLNGFLSVLLNRDNPIGVILRKQYVFKIVPCLNPDGVAKGHYRTDTRGVNLNRVYLKPCFALHPSIYAARSLIKYYHYGFEKEDDSDYVDEPSTLESQGSIRSENSNTKITCEKCGQIICDSECKEHEESYCPHGDFAFNQSGLFLYLDLHGHASKKGIFMYGNHFQDLEKNVDCMLLPKIMSLNNHNFHFGSCNFTERNMYTKDKGSGMSKEGSGRVAVLKLTGLIQSYTLECNYNTGNIVNVLPPTIKEVYSKEMNTLLVPPKYTPDIFEEVGKALASSILDLTGQNPFTRLSNSEFRSLSGLREWLRIYCANELGETKKTLAKNKLRRSSSFHEKSTNKCKCKSNKKSSNLYDSLVEDEVIDASQPSCSSSSNFNVIKKNSGRNPKSMVVNSRYRNVNKRNSEEIQENISNQRNLSSKRNNKGTKNFTKQRIDAKIQTKNVDSNKKKIKTVIEEVDSLESNDDSEDEDYDRKKTANRQKRDSVQSFKKPNRQNLGKQNTNKLKSNNQLTDKQNDLTKKNSEKLNVKCKPEEYFDPIKYKFEVMKQKLDMAKQKCEMTKQNVDQSRQKLNSAKQKLDATKQKSNSHRSDQADQKIDMSFDCIRQMIDSVGDPVKQKSPNKQRANMIRQKSDLVKEKSDLSKRKNEISKQRGELVKTNDLTKRSDTDKQKNDLTKQRIEMVKRNFDANKQKLDSNLDEQKLAKIDSTKQKLDLNKQKPDLTKQKSDLLDLTKQKLTRQSQDSRTRSTKLRLDSKLQTVLENTFMDVRDKETGESDSKITLREICYVRDAEGGKRVIAKYDTGAKDVFEESLVVAWSPAGNDPLLFSSKTTLMAKSLTLTQQQPMRQGSFRVHNFARSAYSKARRSRISRRFSASNVGAIGKTKKVRCKKNSKK